MARDLVNKTVRWRKEVERNTEAYLCGSVPVQNPLLEPPKEWGGYVASAAQPGGPENGL